MEARYLLALAAVCLGLAPSLTLAQTSTQSAPSSPIPAGEVRDAQARFGALRASPSGDVVVERETVAVRCEAVPDALAECEVEARWTLVSPRDQRISLYASTVGVERARLSSGELASDAPSLHPLELPLTASTPVEVVLVGRARLTPSQGMMDPLAARHILLATALEGPHATMLFTRAVERTFARVPTSVELTAALPETFTLHALDAPPGPDGVITLSQSQLEARANVPLRIDQQGGFPVRHGGPFLGLGGTFDRGFRGRLGYELGFGELVVLSVAVDTDFSESFVLGALLEVATPSLVFPPSVSAGVGFAYRTAIGTFIPERPRTSAGLRLEVGAVLAVVGIIASFDYFPDDAAFTSSLLGRLSI